MVTCRCTCKFCEPSKTTVNRLAGYSRRVKSPYTASQSKPISRSFTSGSKESFEDFWR